MDVLSARRTLAVAVLISLLLAGLIVLAAASDEQYLSGKLPSAQDAASFAANPDLSGEYASPSPADSTVSRALALATSNRTVASIVGGAERELSSIIRVADYNGLELVITTKKPIYVDYSRSSLLGLGRIRILGWTCQLLVDIDLDK